MDLQDALHSIRAIPDLPPLITCLGHRSAWEAVPADAWTDRPATAGPLTLVGLTGKVPWFAVESPTPERTAVLLARQISRRGKVAIVLALDVRRRRLGLAVAFDRSPALEFSLDHLDPETLASIARLGGAPDHGSLAFAARAADALSSEPVGRRFFRHFKTTLDRMAAALPGPMPTAR